MAGQGLVGVFRIAFEIHGELTLFDAATVLKDRHESFLIAKVRVRVRPVYSWIHSRRNSRTRPGVSAGSHRSGGLVAGGRKYDRHFQRRGGGWREHELRCRES